MLKAIAPWFNSEESRGVFIFTQKVAYQGNLFTFFTRVHFPIEYILYRQRNKVLLPPIQYSHHAHSHRKGVMFPPIVLPNAFGRVIPNLFWDCTRNPNTLILIDDFCQPAVDVTLFSVVPIAKWFMLLLSWCYEFCHVEAAKSFFPARMIPCFHKPIPPALSGNIASGNCNFRISTRTAIVKVGSKHRYNSIFASTLDIGRPMPITALNTKYFLDRLNLVRQVYLYRVPSTVLLLFYY